MSTHKYPTTCCTALQARREAGQEGVVRPSDSFMAQLFSNRLSNINPRLIQVNDIFAHFL
jgi:hypothetical protein